MSVKTIEDLERSVESLIKETTEGLKQVPDITDRKITEAVNTLRTEMKDYVNSVKQNNVNLGMSEKEVKKFSFANVIRSIAQDDKLASCDYEREVIQAAHQKATVAGSTGGQGGYLIPVEVASEILKPAIADTVMSQLGVQFLTGLTGDFSINGASSRPTLSWGKEGFTPTAQGITFNNKMMRPKTGKMLVTVSNKLLMQASVAEMVVREMIQEGITLGMDQILLTGSGSDSEPLGIINSGLTASTEIGTAGGRLTVDKVASMIADVQDRNFLKQGATGGLLTHPRALSGMKRERVAQFSGDTKGMPLINPLMTNKMLADLLGLTIASTTSVPKNLVKSTSGTSLAYAIVGEWKQFVAGNWGGMRLKSSDVAGTAFVQDELWFLAVTDMDSYVKQKDAFAIISDAQTDETKW